MGFGGWGLPALVLVTLIFDFVCHCCFCDFSWLEMADRVNLHEAKDDSGRGVLHLAAGNGHLQLCRFLVEELGLDVNSISAEGGCDATS